MSGNIFEKPLSMDDIIIKLIPVRQILLAMLQDDNCFTEWARVNPELEKKNMSSQVISLQLQLATHIVDSEYKKHLVTAIINFDSNHIETVEPLKKILTNNFRLRTLIVEKLACFKMIQQIWENNKNIFYDEQHTSRDLMQLPGTSRR